MVNYGKGKIYKIVSPGTNMIYIGSTCKQYLCQRFANHKAHYKRYKDGIGDYVTSYAILEYDDASIVLLESYPCNSKDELLAREQYYINMHKNIIVNKCNSIGTNEAQHKQYIKDYCAKKVICKACNKEVPATHVSRHKKSKRHIKNSADENEK